MRRPAVLIVAAGLLWTGCSSDTASDASDASSIDETEETEQTEQAEETEEPADGATSDGGGGTVDTATADTDDTSSGEVSSGEVSSYRIDVWADNWSAVYVDGELIGEDSVPITTERSFNSESFTFEASMPFTLAIEAKDFKETDSGLEYIGEQNQQMGDGGVIAQVTDLSTGDVVAVTDSGWTALVVHQAPLNTECEDDPDPDSTCEYLILETPADWAAVDFDDSAWVVATEWSAAEVDPKDGYVEIDWDPSAEFIWGTDLEVDNTILLRTTVS